MKKEYALVADFNEDELCRVFYTIQTAIEQKNWDLLDLEACSVKMNEAIRAVACKKRFDQLNEMSKTAIKYSLDGFVIDDHKFETLDEVERAWKLKIFL